MGVRAPERNPRKCGCDTANMISGEFSKPSADGTARFDLLKMINCSANDLQNLRRLMA